MIKTLIWSVVLYGPSSLSFNKPNYAKFTQAVKAAARARYIRLKTCSTEMEGSKTWTMSKEYVKEDVKRLEAFDMWIWRRMEEISWTEDNTNEEVLAMIAEDKALINTIRNRQRKRIGHLIKGDSLLRQLSKGKWRDRKEEEDQDSDSKNLLSRLIYLDIY